MKRIIQILESIAFGDAVGNHALALYRGLIQKGIETAIYANKIDSRLSENAFYLDEYNPDKNDVIIYQLCSGTPLNRVVCTFPGKLIINYHNITPSRFFKPYDKPLAKLIDSAYSDLLYIKDRADMVIGVSEYNLLDLKQIGFTCPMTVIPCLIDFRDYEKTPNKVLIKNLMSGDTKNILFVGRIAPNKCHQNIIEDFYYYHRYYESNSRLILVGSVGGNINYYLRLKSYIKKLKLQDSVIFPGHIPFEDILAYYHSAHVFLCESEHEGLCIPLIEAMYFKVPIVARDTSAIKETLGDAGYLFSDREPVKISAVINTIINNKDIRDEMILEQKKRLDYFDNEKTLGKYINIINKIL